MPKAPFLPQFSLISGSGTGSEYPGQAMYQSYVLCVAQLSQYTLWVVTDRSVCSVMCDTLRMVTDRRVCSVMCDTLWVVTDRSVLLVLCGHQSVLSALQTDFGSRSASSTTLNRQQWRRLINCSHIIRDDDSDLMTPQSTSWPAFCNQHRVQQLTGLVGLSIGPTCQTGQLLDSFHRYPVEQNGSDCRQAIHYVFDNRFHTTIVT